MDAYIPISGAKGGGKGGGGGGSVRTPVEAADTLVTNTTAHITEVISEGEIFGLVNGLQSIFLDGTPVQNPDGSMNYPGLTVQMRNGLAEQPPVDGLYELGREVSYRRKVTQKDGPVIFTIEDPDADGALVKINIPALCMQEASDQNTLGDIKPYGVSFSIAQKGQGGVWEDAKVCSGWVNCGTTTSPGTRKISVTVSAQTPVAQFVRAGVWQQTSKKVTAYYRKTGTTEWSVLGAATLYSELQTKTELVPSTGENKFKTTTTSNPVAKSLSFSVDNLVEGQYEVSCENGSFAAISCYTYVPINIYDKCKSPAELQYRVNLTPGMAPWQIKVTRDSPDAAKSNIQNETWVSGYTVCYYNKFSFPNTAYAHLTVDTSQFGTNVPTREYDIKGIIVQVPDTYNPETREYTGIWLGGFKRAWTDNPAWIFYDLLTNARYGLGRLIPRDKIDTATLYTIAQYCDELVPDGFGGMEPRFTFNGVLNVEKPAVTWLQEVASNFRSMIYQANGNIVLWQDRPEPPSRVLTPENIINGEVEYQGTAKTSRYSQVAVTWNDPADGCKPCPEVAEDPEMMRQFGLIKTSIPGVGIASRGQARRQAEWVLHTNKVETQIASLATGLDCAEVRPGKVLALHDPARAGLKTGGRIKVPGLKTLTLDAPYFFSPDNIYWLSVTMPDGTLDERTIINTGVETDTVTLSTPLRQMPLRGAVWGIKAAGVLEPQLLRVLGIKEDGNKYAITGPIISPSKWDVIEKGWAFNDPPTSNIPKGPLATPVDLSEQEYLYRSGSTVRSAVLFSWRSEDPRVVAFRVRAIAPGEPSARDYGSTAGVSFDIQDTTCGDWVLQVCGVDAMGRQSPWAESRVYLDGMYGPPADVEGFNIAVNGQNALLTWQPVQDLDLDHYELRFSRNREATWEQASVLVPQIIGCSCMVPAMNGAYLIKAVDLVGVSSVSATYIYTDYAGIENTNLVESLEEQTGSFWGSHNGTRNDQEGVCLGVKGDILKEWVALSEIESIEPGMGEFTLTGEYYPARQIDLGGVYPCKLTAQISAYGRSRDNYIKNWLTLGSVPNIAGTNPGQWSAMVEYSSSKKIEPAEEGDWTPWAPIMIGDVQGRHFRFRAALVAQNTSVTPVLTRFDATVDMPDRITKGEDVFCPADGLTVYFSPPYIKTPSMAFSVQGAPQGMRLPEYTATKDEFTVKLFDKDGQPLALPVDYIAVGYGGWLGEGE